ncbi:MAG: hypothetical protein H6849_02460 [Alphaproteobacteria bacterium]|nr:MAG: hypothetical protein H6849_02460 [Alphaproteobacteria bacterium]
MRRYVAVLSVTFLSLFTHRVGAETVRDQGNHSSGLRKGYDQELDSRNREKTHDTSLKSRVKSRGKFRWTYDSLDASKRAHAQAGNASVMCEDLCSRKSCRQDPKGQGRACVKKCREAIFQKNPDGTYALNLSGKHIMYPENYQKADKTLLNTPGHKKSYEECKLAVVVSGLSLPLWKNGSIQGVDAVREDNPGKTIPSQKKSAYNQDQKTLPSESSSIVDTQTSSEVSRGQKKDAEPDVRLEESSSSQRTATDEVPQKETQLSQSKTESEKPADTEKKTKKEVSSSWFSGWFGKSKPVVSDQGDSKKKPPSIKKTKEKKSPKNRYFDTQPLKDLGQAMRVQSGDLEGAEADRSAGSSVMVISLPKIIQAARAGEKTASSAMLKASIAELQRTMYTLKDMIPKANAHEKQMITASMEIVKGLVQIMESSQDVEGDSTAKIIS